MTRRPRDPVEGDEAQPQSMAPRRHLASLELFAGVALVLSTAVAAVVVSIGFARADVLRPLSAVRDGASGMVVASLMITTWLGLAVLLTWRAWRVPQQD